MMNKTFVELVVEYPDPELCTYKEYTGKPYYSIKYTENGETHVGYGTYNPEVLSRYLKEYFMPSAEPEIIRCEDCKHSHWDELFTMLWCHGDIVDKNHFCSKAERRTDEDR